MVSLHDTENPISRKERVKLNQNWDAIKQAFSDVQVQINALSGGKEVNVMLQTIEDNITKSDEVIKKMDQALLDSEKAVIDTNAAKEDALQAAQEATTAKTQAEQATQNANEATQNANEATQNAITAKNEAEAAKDATILATNEANVARDSANTAKEQATQAANTATQAAAEATQATTETRQATIDANLAKDSANQATQEANNAVQQINVLKGELERLQTQLSQQSVELQGTNAEGERINAELIALQGSLNTLEEQLQNAIAQVEQDAQNVITQVEQAAQSANTAFDLIKGWTGATVWSNSVTYAKNNVVTHNGSTFQSKIDDNAGNMPTVTDDNWIILAQRGVDGTGSVSKVNGVHPGPDGNVQLQIASDWNTIAGKPSKFTPEDHRHVITDVDGLEIALNGKANSSHTHNISEIDNLQSTLDDKADKTPATTTTDGLMIASDKQKLDNMNPIAVINELTSTSTDSALSANMGNTLNNNFTALDEKVTRHLDESSGKHIHSSGSNANGHWVKFDDGTLICFMSKEFTNIAVVNARGALFNSDVLLFTYPASFINVPNGTPYVNGSHNQIATASIGVNAMEFFVYRAEAFTIPNATITLTMVGRWKP